MSRDANQKMILALDVHDRKAACRILDAVGDRVVWAKIGLQLFTASGPGVVQMALDRGLKVFLDLKFHDIPNTAKEAVASARRLGVSMTTIHLCGGPEMVSAASSEAGEMLLLGVTVLTSMDEAQLAATGIKKSPADQVTALATMGMEAGISGLVASPREIRILRSTCGTQVKIVTPGIRPSGSGTGDQRRTATPGAAIRDGADFLVLGRPITDSPDPRAAFLAIEEEIRQVSELTNSCE